MCRAVFLCTIRLDGVDPLCCLCHSIHMSALFIGRGLMLDTTLKWSRETSGRQCSWGVRTPPDILAPTPKIYIHIDLVVASIWHIWCVSFPLLANRVNWQDVISLGEDFTLYIAAPAKPAAQKKPAPKGMWWFGHSSDVPVKSFELSEVPVLLFWFFCCLFVCPFIYTDWFGLMFLWTGCSINKLFLNCLCSLFSEWNHWLEGFWNKRKIK